MLKTFYGKRFQPKQTEPKWKNEGWVIAKKNSRHQVDMEVDNQKQEEEMEIHMLLLAPRNNKTEGVQTLDYEKHFRTNILYRGCCMAISMRMQQTQEKYKDQCKRPEWLMQAFRKALNMGFHSLAYSWDFNFHPYRCKFCLELKKINRL